MVNCRCAEGSCFLEKDAEWAKQNYAHALHPNGFSLDRMLLGALEIGRLRQKNEWMDLLGVSGTCQINCRHKAVESETKDMAVERVELDAIIRNKIG